MTSVAIDVLAMAAAAPTNAQWLVAEARSNSVFRFRADVRADDGEVHAFALVLMAHEDNTVSVLESATGRKLPAACPERHINGDGSFCLGPGSERIETIERAEQWWATLAGFLELQLRANETRAWPRAYSWPHGAAAASQMRLEAQRQNLPAPIAKLLRAARLRSDGLLVDRRQRCPCGKKRQVRRCHEETILSIMKLEADVVRKEKLFWRAWTLPCCRSMISCPLNTPAGTVGAVAARANADDQEGVTGAAGRQ